MLNKNIKVDLHIHSKASEYKEGPGLVDYSDIAHIPVLMGKLEENEINLFSITDHNRFDFDLYVKIADWLDANPSSTVKGLLAGVEFDVSFDESKPACHVVTIFDVGDRMGDPVVWRKNCQRIQSAVEDDMITGKNGSYSLARFEQLLKKINLATVLIAHQHQGLENAGVKKRSLGSATDSAEEYIKYGYIDALEYTKANVQGILLNEFQDLNLDAATVCGSDCHDWSVYPAHDKSQNAKPRPYFTIRALPTFKGLVMALTSVDTRFNKPNLVHMPGMIKGISVNGKRVDFSPGINVIIGENGIGKSSLMQALLSDTRLRHVNTFIADQGISVDGQLSEGGFFSISQGELQDKFYKDGSSGLFDPSLFRTVDHSRFEARVQNFSNQLKNGVSANIKKHKHLDALSKTSVLIKDELEGSKSFFFQLHDDSGFSNIDNPHLDHVENVSGALEKLNIEQQSGYYDSRPELRTRLERAIAELSLLLSELKTQSNGSIAEQRVRNAISNAIASYDARTASLKTAEDQELANYRRAKTKVVDSVLNAIRDATVSAPAPHLTLDGRMGVSSNPSNGFRFVSTALYADSGNIENDFLRFVFNKDYRMLSKVLSITSDEEASRAVNNQRARGHDWRAAWDQNVSAFISKQEMTRSSIHENDSDAIGGTLGEMSLTYFKYQAGLNESMPVFLADQPEDNISNSRIAGELTAYFDRMRLGRQLIVITHNPLLVVNQDADNVLVLSRDKKGKLRIKSGCLESDGILPAIAKNMEGGVRAIRRRLKAYGTYSED